MNLTAQQKRICEQVINVFESGSIQGDYSTISIYSDGPHKMRQVYLWAVSNDGIRQPS